MLARLENVTKRYRTTEGVRDLTLEFPAGEIVGVLGLNGSGKSTMLKLVAGLLFPTAGTITVFGGSARGNRSRTVFLGETDTLWPWMTPTDACRFMEGLYADFDTVRFHELLHVLEVPRRKTKAMSKGERGRLRLAMAGAKRQALPARRAAGRDRPDLAREDHDVARPRVAHRRDDPPVDPRSR